jgi:hypothetical protein
MSPKSTKTTFYLDPQHVEALERRGARPDRGRGPFGRSNVLRRYLDLASCALQDSDPRVTHELPEAYLELAVELLPDAHELAPQKIRDLAHHFEHMRELHPAARAAGVSPRDFIRAMHKLPYAERFFIVDYAEQKNAGRYSR